LAAADTRTFLIEARKWLTRRPLASAQMTRRQQPARRGAQSVLQANIMGGGRVEAQTRSGRVLPFTSV
jgi:hypothetical protein